MEEPDERRSRAWLCAHLTELQAFADRGGWRETLDREARAVRAGGSAVTALARLGVNDAQDAVELRGTKGPATADVWDPVEVSFEYVCPADVCQRRSRRDRLGRTPMCRLDETPMSPRRRGDP